MALPSFSADTAWQDDIEEIHSEFRKGVINIYRGKTLLISGRSARIQHLRSPAVAHDSGQQIAKRSFLFEIELLSSDPVIKKDDLVRVTDGGRDPQLVNYGFIVTNSVNSSEAAIRTIETLTELAILPAVS